MLLPLAFSLALRRPHGHPPPHGRKYSHRLHRRPRADLG
jgi:hypothetical protein